MKTRTSYVLIAMLAVVGTFSISPAFAQGFYDEEACPDCQGDDVYQKELIASQTDVPIQVWTDAALYDHQSTIKVQGVVANLRSGVPITLTVISPLENIVTIRQIDVNMDKTFETSLNTAGNLWKYDGTYVIRVQYQNQEVSDKALVELTGGIVTGPDVTVTCGAGELSASGHCIPFSLSAGAVTGASINTDDKSVIVRISSTEDGEITLNPSTEIIRGIFMVLVDGEEWDDVTIDGNDVTVMFPAGTEEIEIIGTFVIPEFGAIAALILAVAIVSIIVVSAKTRLSIIPKF